MQIAGKNAVVIGGASGIGAGICRALCARRATIDICDLDGAGARAQATALAKLGSDAGAYPLDITREAMIAQVELAIRRARGRIDLVFANAGAICLKSFGEATSDDWRWLFGINVIGCANVVRAFLPGMLAQPGKSRIAVTSSITALRTPAMPGQSLYMATKAAQFGFFRGLETELVDSNVALSVIFPGPVATSLRQTSEAQRPGAVRLAVSAAATNVGYMTADEAGERIVDAIARDKRYIATHPDDLPLIEAEQDALHRELQR